MRLPRVRSTISGLMTVVALSAIVVTPFAWTAPGSRWRMFLAVLTVGAMGLILASPSLLDRPYGDRRIAPRRAMARPPGPARTRGRSARK